MRKSRKNQRDIARVEDIRSIVESIGQEPRDTLTYEEQKAFFDAEIKRQQQERQRRQNHEEPELEASEA